MKRTLSFITLCAIAAAAHAQQTTEPTRYRETYRTFAPAQAQGRGLAPGQRGALSAPRAPLAALQTAARPAWLEKEIDLNFRNEKPMDAIKLILKVAGRPLETVDIAQGLPTPQISLTIKNVKVGDALAAVGRLANATASVLDKDDKTTVYLRKRSPIVTPQIFTTSSISGVQGFSPELQRQIGSAIDEAHTTIKTVTPRMNSFVTASLLPEKRVSLDVRNTDARDILKNLLKQADVDYVLEEDLPDNKKFNFTFENVPLRTALDIVCQSLEVGWGAQKTNDSKKVMVRIGKKWLTRSTGVGSFFKSDVFENGFNTQFAYPAYPDVQVDRKPEIALPEPDTITVNGIGIDLREIEVL